MFSFLPIITLLYCIALYFCRDSSCSCSQSVDETLRLSFGVFLVYLGFCFSTYMLLACINDPIATGFVYLIVVLCIGTEIALIHGAVAEKNVRRQMQTDGQLFSSIYMICQKCTLINYLLPELRIFSAFSYQNINLISCILTFWRIIVWCSITQARILFLVFLLFGALMGPFDPYSPFVFIILVSRLMIVSCGAKKKQAYMTNE